MFDRTDLDLSTANNRAESLNQGFRWATQAFAIGSMIVLFWMIGVILMAALPAMRQFGLGFLWSQDWNIGELVFGGLPYIYGTLVTSTIAVLLAVPVGIAVALVTSETFLPRWLRSPLAILIELIAAIPSVIIGLWGIFVLIPFLVPVQQWLFRSFGWLPLFGTEPIGAGTLVAGVILAIMILPTIAAISREVLLALPRELQAASRALGATLWETLFRIILPMATPGILGAVTLGLGRALGETMAVTMVIGNSTQLSLSLLDLGSTIPAVLANQFAEALDDLHISALMYLALILFVLTLGVNILASYIIESLSQSRGMDNP
ncbi:phosphate ABC transporter permease subunit PstC [Phormidium tenue FACHB-886]|nr:phosphate ABC transporter permease subunit PstC [Phormidium tenue FACHB-886]